MKRISTHRVLQLHQLADDMASRARIATRAAVNLARIGNCAGYRHMAARAARFAAIAEAAERRLRVSV